MAFKRSRQPNNSNNKGYNHNYLQQQNQETEKQNELKIEHLKNKVIGIKSISYDIQNEIRSQNQLLDELENNFSSANSLLDRTSQLKIFKMVKCAYFLTMDVSIFDIVLKGRFFTGFKDYCSLMLSTFSTFLSSYFERHLTQGEPI
ncbi:bet1 [Anaeramoeba flamelloides]|uniref:Bet1 n=1 Tax=Anaeramoeba flamelloides TaxID=1746091 RepID=A0AAV7YPD3_9EUKA|nr:bet1 [Anaeramoeba flamelloides]